MKRLSKNHVKLILFWQELVSVTNRWGLPEQVILNRFADTLKTRPRAAFIREVTSDSYHVYEDGSVDFLDHDQFGDEKIAKLTEEERITIVALARLMV